MILALRCCVARKERVHTCLRVRTYLHVSRFIRVCVCVCLRAKNKDSIWFEPLNAPVWNTSVILNSLFEAAPRWSRARRRAARGPIWGVRSRREPPSWNHSLLRSEAHHSHQERSGVWWSSSPPLTSAALQFNTVWLHAQQRERGPRQTLLISSQGSEGFIQGAAGGGGKGHFRRRISEGAGRDLDWWILLPASPATPHRQ